VRAPRSLIWVLAGLLVFMFAGVFGVPASASAVTSTYVYDTASYANDGALRLSTVHATVLAALGSLARPKVASWVTPVSVVGDVVATNGAAPRADSSGRRNTMYWGC
jgi:hypothetical protein